MYLSDLSRLLHTDLTATYHCIPGSEINNIVMEDTSKWHSALRNAADVVLLGLVGLAVLLTYLLGDPFIRGFFCNDNSIQYPYHESTVSSLALGLGVFLVPAILIAIVELTAANAWQSNHHHTCQRVPQGIVSWTKRYGVFLFGAGVCYILVDLGKLVVGRLRPHFLDVCQMTEDCPATGYITSYTCTGDVKLIDDARKSFPSGHATLSFYSAVFLVLYLHVTFRWRNPRLLRHTLQVLLLVAAWYVSLTRITDYKHHAGDVTGGVVIGTTIALLNVFFVSDLDPGFSAAGKGQDI